MVAEAQNKATLKPTDHNTCLPLANSLITKSIPEITRITVINARNLSATKGTPLDNSDGWES